MSIEGSPSRSPDDDPRTDRDADPQTGGGRKELPASEVEKEEEMPFERREPSAVFGLVAGSYLIILIGLLLIIAAVIWWRI